MNDTDNGEFLADGLQANDKGDKISLTFEDKDGAHRSVTLRRSSIPSLISLLQNKIEAGSVTPINPGSLFVGQSFALEAFQASRKPDGSARILFFVRLPDQNNRGVTLPLDLTPAEAADLVKSLNPP
jgi:hypothetical protein